MNDDVETITLTVTAKVSGRDLDRDMIGKALAYHGSGLALAVKLPHPGDVDVELGLDMRDDESPILLNVSRELAARMPLELEGRLMLRLDPLESPHGGATHDLVILHNRAGL